MKTASGNSGSEPTAPGRTLDSIRLDGNAAAGILSEIFAPDLTTGRAKCAGCGKTRTIGTLHVYAHGMGMIMRCPGCEGVILRVARTPTRLWLDARGAVSIVIEGRS